MTSKNTFGQSLLYSFVTTMTCVVSITANAQKATVLPDTWVAGQIQQAQEKPQAPAQMPGVQTQEQQSQRFFIPPERQALNATGTGVGNGGLRRQGPAVVAAPPPVVATSAQPNVMQNYFHSERLLDQASQSLRHELYESRDEAYEAYIFAMPDSAYCTLLGAMERSAKRIGNGPMTRIILDRSIAIGRGLATLTDPRTGASETTNCAYPTNKTSLGRKTRAMMMFEWAKLAIDVSEDFDPKYYMPYRTLYKRCYPSPDHCDRYRGKLGARFQEFDYRRFERGLVELARKQLNLMLENFIVQGPEGLEPFGSMSTFLNVSAMLSAALTDDLINNGYAYAYHRSVVALNSLAIDLRRGGRAHHGIFDRAQHIFAVASENLSVDITFPHCDQECASKEDGWVTPDKDWQRPQNESQIPPGFRFKTQEGWVSPR